jgi:hypothetical protein
MIECDKAGDAPLLQAVDEAAKLYLKTNSCIAPIALSQWRQFYPKGFPKVLVEELRAKTSGDGLADPGKIGWIRREKAEAAKEAAAKKRRGKAAKKPPEPPPGAEDQEEMVPLDAEIIQMAALHIHDALAKGLIKARCGADTSGAAEWKHDPDCGKKFAICGEIVFGRDSIENIKNHIAAGGEDNMYTQDQVANSVIHEIGHAFVSFFDNVLDTKLEGDCPLTKYDKEFIQFRHWNGCPNTLGVHKRGDLPGYQLTSGGYAASSCGEKTTRQIAHQLFSCGRFAANILGIDPPSTCSSGNSSRDVTFTPPAAPTF